MSAYEADVKVLDFGIARVSSALSSSKAHVSKTRTGRVMGTPIYMAPEQARGETSAIDQRTDLWAVGAIIFRGLTGRYVYEAVTPEMTMVKAATQQPPKLREILPTIDERLAEIVDRAIAWKKEDRWLTADAMLEAIADAGPIKPEEALLKTLPLAKRVASADAANANATEPMANAPVQATRPIAPPPRGGPTRARAPSRSTMAGLSHAVQSLPPSVSIPTRWLLAAAVTTLVLLVASAIYIVLDITRSPPEKAAAASEQPSFAPPIASAVDVVIPVVSPSSLPEATVSAPSSAGGLRPQVSTDTARVVR